MNGYLNYSNIYGIIIYGMGALGSTRVAEDILLQPEDRTPLASKHSRTLSSWSHNVALSEGFYPVDELVDWVRFLFIDRILGSSAEMKIQRIQIRAVCWPGMISSPSYDSTFTFIVQES